MVGLARLAEIAKDMEAVASRGDAHGLGPLQAAAEAALRDAGPLIEDRLRAAWNGMRELPALCNE